MRLLTARVQTYTDETGHSIDALWQLEEERLSKPQYSTWTIPAEVMYGDDIPSDVDEPFLPNAASRRSEKKKKEKTALVKQKKRFRDPEGRRPRMAIMAEDEEDGDEYLGMPGLMSVSESSDDGIAESSSDDEDEDDEEEEDESEWEGDERNKMQAMLAEAMREFQRKGGKIPPWTEESEVPGGDGKVPSGNMKSNPFMKMLRSFAGQCHMGRARLHD